MNPNEINRRIAIACGWLDIKEQADDCGTFGLWGVPARHAKAVGLGSAFDYSIPDYHGDLNAMHEAVSYAIEKSLFEASVYRTYLADCSSESTFWHATAAQRAEAFLRTIGQWEEAL